MVDVAAKPEGALARPPRPVVSLDDVLLELIDIGDNVRDDVGDLDELAASIAELGVLDPVKVTRQPDGRYRLVWGQRRVLASKKAGQLRIPALIEPPSDIDTKGARRSIEQLSENLQRKDLNDIEEAVALRDVLDGHPELTQAALAQRLGRSPSWLANTLRLLELDAEVQTYVRTGAISASHAKAIVTLPPKAQREIATRIVRDQLPAHRIESELAWKRQEAESEAARQKRTAKWIPKTIAALEAAEVPKTSVIQIAPSYNVELAPILKAVKDAGWKKAESGVGYYGGYGSGPSKKCDCTSVRLEVGGRKAEVAKHCTNEAHRASAVSERDREANEKVKQRNRELEVLRDAVEREVSAAGIHVEVLRLLWRGTTNASYYGGPEPNDIPKAIARNVLQDWRFRDEDLRPLFATLGLEFPEPKPARAKKAAKA